jgi:ATP-dependent Lon protease
MAVEEKQLPPPEEAAIQGPEELPILTVRDTVVFPGALAPITVGRPASLALVNSLGENRTLAVVSQLDPRVDVPTPEDLYPVGTVCVLHKAIRVPKENLLLFCEGVSRIRTTEFTAREPFLKAKVERIPDVEPEVTPEIEALRQNVISLFQQIVAASPNLSDDLATTAEHITEPGGRHAALAQPGRAAETAGRAGRAGAAE